MCSLGCDEGGDLRSRRMRIIIYINDIMIISESTVTLGGINPHRSMLGFIINTEKSVMSPTHAFAYYFVKKKHTHTKDLIAS